MKIHLPIEVLELHRFASTDDNRHNLAHVLLKPVGADTIQAVATDGHVLAKMEWTHNGDQLPEAVLLSGQDLQLQLKRATKKERLLGALYDPEEEKLNFLDQPGYSISSAKLVEDGGKVSYPDVDPVIPKKGLGTATNESESGEGGFHEVGVIVGFDLRLFSMIEGFLKATNNPTKIQVQISEPPAPFRIDTFLIANGSVNAIFVVLPCRI